MQRLLLTLVIAALPMGCGILKLVPSDGSGGGGDGPEGHHVQLEGRTYRVGPYWGPECDRIGAYKNEVNRGESEAEPTMGKQPNLSADPADQFLRLVCVEQILSSESEPERNTWVTQHFRFDELYFDHTTAAMMLVECLKASSCLGEGAPHHHEVINNPEAMKWQAEQERAPRNVWQYYEVGMMRWYADHVDAKQVAAKLATIPGLPAAAQQAFMTQLDRAKTRVIAVSDELAPDAKKLFVDLPAAVYNQRTAEHARNGKVIAELGLLITRMKSERASGVTDETISKLRDLRIAYHASCKADCTRGVVFAAITKQLFWAYVARGDAAAAMAESKLLDHLDPTAQQEIATKQSDQIIKAMGRTHRVASAREQGIDADTASSTANGKLLDLGDGRYIYEWKDDFKIYYEALIPDGSEVGHVGGKVAALEKKGGNILVRFQDEFSSDTEGTDCFESNRIDGIDSSGKLIYRQECRGSVTHVQRRKVDPVTIPANEAGALHGGDEIVGFAKGAGDARLGRIWIVKRGEHVTRLREMAL
ncbi:MAG: hypothetical protein ABJE66_14350 [Deltaproteobacteria bacterium]